MNTARIHKAVVSITLTATVLLFSGIVNAEDVEGSPGLRKLMAAASRFAGTDAKEKELGLNELKAIVSNDQLERSVRQRAAELLASSFLAERVPADQLPAMDFLRAAAALSQDPPAIARHTVNLATCQLRLASDPAGACESLNPWVARLDELPRELQRDVLVLYAHALGQAGRAQDSVPLLDLLLSRALWQDHQQQIAWRIQRALLSIEEDDIKNSVALLRESIIERAAEPLSPYITQLQPLQVRLIEMGAQEFMHGLLSAMAAARADDLSGDVVKLRLAQAAFLYNEMGDVQAALKVLGQNDNLLSQAPGNAALTDALHAALCDRMSWIALVDPHDPELTRLSYDLLTLSNGNPLLMRKANAFLVLGQFNVERVQTTAKLLREAIAAHMASGAVVLEAQNALVRVLMQHPQTRSEAVQEATLLFRLSPDALAVGSAELLSAAFKVNDANLGRSNRLLRFLKFGTAGEDGQNGTDDDISNPMDGIRVPDSQDRTALYLRTLSKVYTPEARARCLVLIGRPDQAFDALLDGFRNTPAVQRDIQLAATALSELVIRYTNDHSLAVELTGFLQDGTYVGTSPVERIRGILKNAADPRE